MRVFVVWTPHLSQQPIPQHDCTWFVKTAFELVLNFAGLYRGVGLYIHTAARLADTKRIWRPTPCILLRCCAVDSSFLLCSLPSCSVCCVCAVHNADRQQRECGNVVVARSEGTIPHPLSSTADPYPQWDTHQSRLFSNFNICLKPLLGGSYSDFATLFWLWLCA